MERVEKWDREGKAIKGMLINKWLLQATGAQSCWGSLGDPVEQASEMVHLRKEGAGVFTLQLLSVMSTPQHFSCPMEDQNRDSYHTVNPRCL